MKRENIIYLLNRKIHNCWIFFNKECIFCESLKSIKNYQICKNANYIDTNSRYKIYFYIKYEIWW